MERHVSHSALVRVFSGQAAVTTAEPVALHLARCRRCWDRAAGVIAELRSEGLLETTSDTCHAVLILLEEEEREALSRLRARGWWADLRRLPARQQLDRIKADPALRTLEMFSMMAEEASKTSQDDPHLSEETASVAHALAGTLPESSCPEPFRNDLQAKALSMFANCRRLAGDWRGSAAAFGKARGHLQQGTGEPLRRARLLSLQASLASDTGRLEQALGFLARAAKLYRAEQDPEAVASVMVQEASTLLAASHYEEAIARAGEALESLAPEETRLEMLARNIITESLVFLERPAEALQSLLATQALFQQLWGQRTELQVDYLEALLLDAVGSSREADKAFRNSIAGRMEAELYKDAFLTLVTHLQSLVRRGAFDKAARACEEALAMIEQAGSGCHSQMSELWRDLLALINARRLTERQVLVARQYLVRHWNAPARHAPLELAAGRPEPSRLSAETVPAVEASFLLAGPGEEPSSSPSAPVTDLGHGGYEEALKRYDRDLLAASLAQCGGRIREASRLLGISRNTLRAKIKRHGLAAGEPEPAPADPGRVRRAEAVEALKKIHAHAWWAELKRLPHREQLERIRTVAAIQTREMVETILREASTAAPNDPRKGQQTALLAHTLAGLLPRSRCPEPLRNDLQAAALLAVAESRRSAGDQQGVAEVLGAARSHLERGTGQPSPAARLLAAQASLASDRGQVEQALALLERAAALYRRAQDPAAVAAVKIQEAGALRAARRHEEALARAQEVLRAVPRETPRLAIQAWAVQVESLVFLERPKEALRSLRLAELRYEDSWGFRTDLHWEILGAFVLESLGYARDADSLFRGTLARFREAGLHKDASLILLSRCELLIQREELDRAVQVCEAALAGSAAEEPWRSLLPLARERRLTEGDLREARACILRSGLSGLPTGGTPDPVEPPASVASLDLHAVLITPPDPVASLAEEGYKQALERYDRQLIAAGLAQCQGRIAEACRLLGLSPKHLRAKLRRYFLTGVEEGGGGLLV